MKCNDESQCVMGVYIEKENDSFCKNEKCGLDLIWVSQELKEQRPKGDKIDVSN